VATDLTIVLADRPNGMADLCTSLGAAGINIDGICGVVEAGIELDHLLFEDAVAAISVIESSGATVRGMRDVLVIQLEDRPGAVGEVTGRIAAAGVRIDLIYLAANNRLVIGADNLPRARAALV